MALPLAHLGHWWSYILYAVPLAIVLGSIVVTTIRDRRAAHDGEGEPADVEGGDADGGGAPRPGA